MNRPRNSWLALAVCSVGVFVATARPHLVTADDKLRGVMLSAEQATAAMLRDIGATDANAVVLQLIGVSREQRQRELAAARRIQESGSVLYYWIEIARCPELADAHPEWMASLQGHDQWRRLFKDAPQPKKDVEVIKNYPWVPVLYEESFQAHLRRVEQLLDEMPTAKGVFLNDLQGAPSACGCGNPLCRWTADYGPIKTATPVGPDAAAQFVAAVKKLSPESEVIPVWVTECEEHDGAKDGFCAGVGCYKGICWKAWMEQLRPLAKQSERIAVLLPFRELGRDIRLYGDKAGWVRHGLESFQKMPAWHGAEPVPVRRLIAVLQGWDVSQAEIKAQQKHADEAGAEGYIVSRTEIDQTWQPRLYKVQR